VTGFGDEGGVQRRDRWLWWQERWQRGWQAIDGDKATRAMAMVTATVRTWLMATVTRLAGDKEGKGEGGKGDGNGDEGGGRRSCNGDGDNGGRRAMAMATKNGDKGG
jgi:hypothetical protein